MKQKWMMTAIVLGFVLFDSASADEGFRWQRKPYSYVRPGVRSNFAAAFDFDPFNSRQTVNDLFINGGLGPSDEVLDRDGGI